MSAFLSRFKANYLEKIAWLPPFFFVDSNSPCIDLLFSHGPNLAQKPLQLVGTVLKIRVNVWTVCRDKKSCHCREVTFVERWPLVEVGL